MRTLPFGQGGQTTITTTPFPVKQACRVTKNPLFRVNLFSLSLAFAEEPNSSRTDKERQAESPPRPTCQTLEARQLTPFAFRTGCSQ